MANPFDYAPAPESRAIVDIKPSYGLFIDGEFVDGHGKAFKTVNPASEEVLAEIAEADDDDVDLAVKAARRAHGGLGRGCRARSGPSTSTGSPGSSRSAPASSPCSSRSTTASRSRSRATSTYRSSAAHFFYYAGWADKLEYAGFGEHAARASPPRSSRGTSRC